MRTKRVLHDVVDDVRDHKGVVRYQLVKADFCFCHETVVAASRRMSVVGTTSTRMSISHSDPLSKTTGRELRLPRAGSPR
jgi:hypothetical protein